MKFDIPRVTKQNPPTICIACRPRCEDSWIRRCVDGKKRKEQKSALPETDGAEFHAMLQRHVEQQQSGSIASCQEIAWLCGEIKIRNSGRSTVLITCCHRHGHGCRWCDCGRRQWTNKKNKKKWKFRFVSSSATFAAEKKFLWRFQTETLSNLSC